MLLLLSSDRWVEGEGKGGVKGSLLMKQKKKGKICFVIYIAGERFFFIYEVIAKQKKKNALLITTSICQLKCQRSQVEDSNCGGSSICLHNRMT